MSANEKLGVAFLLFGAVAVVVGILVLLLPYFIARRRGHAYRNVILVLSIFGFFGITWIIAMVWAVFPSEKTIADPVMGNPTGIGSRNVGDTLGAVAYGRERGYAMEQQRSDMAAPVASPSAPKSSARFCSSCGIARREGAVFCATCGHRM